MTSNVKMILDEVNARIKLAEAKTAEDPSNFDSFPGAENDKAVPAEMKNPDPEVKEEGPASRTEVAGATPGSDAPVQQDHLYEADEPVLTPEKKPAETADANAKVAAENPEVAKVAADILNILKTNMKTPEPEKKAEKNMISLESKILDKIASVRTNKQAEANETSAMLKFAEEYNRGVNDARALLQKLAQEMAAEEAGAAGAADAAAAAGAADAEAAIADAQKTAAAQDEVTRYQQGFIQKCAEYGVEPQRLAQYIQARTAGTY